MRKLACLFGGWHQLIHAYRKDTRGNFAAIFALSAMMLLAGVGAAIDHSRLNSYHQSAQDSLDSAALGAATYYQKHVGEDKVRKNRRGTDKVVEQSIAHGEEIFRQNCLIRICGEEVDLQIHLNPTSSVSASYKGAIKPEFMHMFGYKYLPFSNVAEVNLGIDTKARNLDMVMIIDTTMSMAELGDAVKNNMHDFAADLSIELASMGEDVGRVRVKFIFFRDYAIDNYHLWTGRNMALIPGMERYGPMYESPFFSLPADRTDLDAYVDFFATRGGGSLEESSLEALHHAMTANDWSTDGETARLIALWTDQPPRQLHDKTEANLTPTSTSWTSATWDRWIGDFFTIMNHADREQYMYDTYYPKEVPTSLAAFQTEFENFHTTNQTENPGVGDTLILNMLNMCSGSMPCGDWNTVGNWSGVKVVDVTTKDTQNEIYQQMLDQATDWISQTTSVKTKVRLTK